MTDLETVADLEVCGLSVRTAELLGSHGYLHIQQLKRLTAADLLRWRNGGPETVEEIRAALRCYCEGRVVRTPEQCASIPKPRGGR